jgi:hypothetical protein
VTFILGCQSQHTEEKNAWLMVLGIGFLDTGIMQGFWI